MLQSDVAYTKVAVANWSLCATKFTKRIINFFIL